jgi:outer membrane lipase/esterase
MKLNLLNPTLTRLFRTLALITATGLLASCGGGVSQSQTFTANRVLAFGDEHSVINSDGSKYTVNALAADGVALDCNNNVVWVQTVATHYGLTFPQCTSAAAAPASRILATPGASVSDLAAQIDQQISAGGIQAGDLATVLVGSNDVAAQLLQLSALGEGALLARIDAAGAALAQQVNRLAELGAKVVVATIPDMGLTPFAGDRSAGSTNPNPALLSKLSRRFNDAMLVRITNDGRKIGLVLLDEYLQATDRARAAGVAGSYANTTAAACTVALPQCANNTLVAGATTTTWLWADELRLGAGAQANLGALAVARIRANPF